MFRSLTIAGAIVVLSACDLSWLSFEPRNASAVCKKYPEMCSDMNSDGWCRTEREGVVMDRYRLFKDEQDYNKYRLMLSLQQYNRCIEIASTIEPKYDSSRKTRRVEGLINSYDALSKMEQETKQSSDPFLAMYHWTTYRDMAARDRFLALEGTSALNHPELQWTLASYYSKSDVNRGLQLLRRMIPMYPEGQAIPVKIPEAIIGAYMQLENYEAAYVWALVAAEFPQPTTQDYRDLAFLLDVSEDKKKALQQKAEALYQSIEERSYNPG